MNIKNIMIAGGGNLGSQVAWQCAVKGFNVVVYDAFEKGLETSKSYHQAFGLLFINERGMTEQERDDAFQRISYTTNLEEASRDIDLVNESIPENIEIKKHFYTKLSQFAPAKTIFTTNSSATLPSDYASFTDRPEKFLALHFANGIWDANIGEVMGHSGTDPMVFNRVLKFAEEIGMVPIPIHKEQNGYIINSLLIPLLKAGVDLLRNNVTDIESIDKTWMICTNTKVGPLGIMDIIGMQTIYNIYTFVGESTGDQLAFDRAHYIKNNFIDKGKMGISSGEGFYKYPNPAYEDENFLS
ncbi:3-hydroxyacyl-CoA dehydrogenase [Flammeovirga sp. EKP202]|uniref:3-hydroxyacyl-CoA dehydrogenase n=1 Tax=Flammeovirga sp. EKP202 TaxID=2770592 RepID=UPI00165F383C|nr:3-hydroxyacyl-CoA dehydrogenase [Flammeovirga sp. EKP202]MBD0405326.1 3-hydroxyacyl-CoA dehydrogenase [Flammeovirga sp. EKP202]